MKKQKGKALFWEPEAMVDCSSAHEWKCDVGMYVFVCKNVGMDSARLNWWLEALEQTTESKPNHVFVPKIETGM